MAMNRCERWQQHFSQVSGIGKQNEKDAGGDRPLWMQGLIACLSSTLVLTLAVPAMAVTGGRSPLQLFRPQLPDLPPLPSVEIYLPEAEQVVTHLVLDLGDRRVFVQSDETVLASYPVAIGTQSTPTPTGQFEVFEMVENPVWQSPWTGEVHPPGPNSALGVRWIGFARMPNGVIGFHGTPTVSSIGRAASNGCVRLRNEHVLELFSQVQIGMTVLVRP